MKVVVSYLFTLVSIFVFVNSQNNLAELIEEVLSDDDLFFSYFDCVMDREECPPGGDLLKEQLPQALEDDCSSCEDGVKELMWKVIASIVKDRPKQWKELLEKYDPAGKYVEKYSEELKSRT